jgi:hypothetical protein
VLNGIVKFVSGVMIGTEFDPANVPHDAPAPEVKNAIASVWLWTWNVSIELRATFELPEQMPA